MHLYENFSWYLDLIDCVMWQALWVAEEKVSVSGFSNGIFIQIRKSSFQTNGDEL